MKFHDASARDQIGFPAGGGEFLISTWLQNCREPAGRRLAWFAFSTLLLGLMFALPLARTVRFCLKSELQSYILLIPIISIYLIYQKHSPGPKDPEPARGLAAALFLCGGLAMGLNAILMSRNHYAGVQDSLTLPVFAFTSFLVAMVALCFGAGTVRNHAFPLLFLFAGIPLPETTVHWLQMALQQCSADATHALFILAGTPVLRDGMAFHLPGLTVVVAEECSGIHSTLILFIVSLIAGYLFLQRPWSRALFALAVIPLGVIRNGFRVVALSLLTIHVDSRIMDSALHQHGGPIFFGLSLFVLLGLLLSLRWCERKVERGKHAIS